MAAILQRIIHQVEAKPYNIGLQIIGQNLVAQGIGMSTREGVQSSLISSLFYSKLSFTKHIWLHLTCNLRILSQLLIT